MSNKPLARIALVQLSPNSKRTYAMRCDRKNLGVGHRVQVLMDTGTDKEVYKEGLITAIIHERWDCSCHVVNHISEISYEFDANEQLERIVNERHDEIPIDVPLGTGNDLKKIYEALANEADEDVYLSDGMWLSSDGSIKDHKDK